MSITHNNRSSCTSSVVLICVENCISTEFCTTCRSVACLPEVRRMSILFTLKDINFMCTFVIPFEFQAEIHRDKDTEKLYK